MTKEKNQKVENQLKDLEIQMAKLEKQIEELTEMEKTNPEGKVLSGSILTFAGHKAYYLYGASSNEYRDYLPNYNMQLTMMRIARDRGAKTYDFGGQVIIRIKTLNTLVSGSSKKCGDKTQCENRRI